jgi:hypothetical protein
MTGDSADMSAAADYQQKLLHAAIKRHRDAFPPQRAD